MIFSLSFLKWWSRIDYNIHIPDSSQKMTKQYPDPDFIKSFRSRVLWWGEKNTHSFPWRYQDDSYKILVSEFMLHRTQVRQVLPVYNDFIGKYPTLTSLCSANKQEILANLKCLGLTWRNQGMITALNELWISHCEVPASFEQLLSIKGIGNYIAGATVCFSQNIKVTLIDTNTVRIVGRVLGLSLKGEARRQKPMIEAIGRLTDPSKPRDFYYAIIDIAHSICKTRDPNCQECPLYSLPCKFAEELQTSGK
jgi:A/G-specific adenine glycosylase